MFFPCSNLTNPCNQEERTQRTESLLTRAATDVGTNDTEGSTGNTSSSTQQGPKAASSSAAAEAAVAVAPSSRSYGNSNGVGEEASGEAGTGLGAGAAGARGEQLASLLSKAEQYSMFIRQSQV